MKEALRSLDGTVLAAEVLIPNGVRRGVVLVHGGGVDRHEGGFFDRLSDGLAEAGLASLRFDLRGHGESGGASENLTLSGVGNDVRAAIEHLAREIDAERISVLGASFSGGICAALAALRPDLIDRLVLFNPLLDYKKRFIDEKDYWADDRITPSMAERLAADGYVAHSPSFRLGTALLNEVFWWNVRDLLPQITVPTLIVHGTGDTFIPVASSRTAVAAMTCPVELVELEGAQHGFAVHDDPGYQHPQTQVWQRQVITTVSGWLRRG